MEYSTVKVRKDHGRWSAYVYYTDSRGKRRQKTHPTGVACNDRNNNGRKAAETIARQWRDDIVKADMFTVTTPDSTLEEVVKGYLDHLSAHDSVGTMQTHRATAKHHIFNDPVARIKLADFTSEDAMAYIDRLATTAASARTQQKAVGLLNGAIRYEAMRGHVRYNPFDITKKPSTTGRTRPTNALDADGAKVVMDMLGKIGDRQLALAAEIAMKAGLRRAEVCGLKWSDIDLNAEVIHVQRRLIRASRGYQPADYTKNGKPRTVYVGETGLTTSLRRAQGEQRREAGNGWSEEHYVIGTNAGRTWMSPDTLGSRWKALARLIDIRGTHGLIVTFHDLRRTYGTLTIRAGGDVKALQSSVGHSSARTTMDYYVDALADSKKAAARRLAEMMGWHD